MKSILLIFSLSVITALSGCRTSYDDILAKKNAELKTAEYGFDRALREWEEALERRPIEVYFKMDNKWVLGFYGDYKDLLFKQDPNKEACLEILPDKKIYFIPMFRNLTEIKIVKYDNMSYEELSHRKHVDQIFYKQKNGRWCETKPK